MKTTAILAAICLLAPCTLTAQEEATPAPAAPAPAAEASATPTYDALTAEQKAAVDTLVTTCDQATDSIKGILTGIKDRETADAAAPQLQAIFDQLDVAWDKISEDLLPAVHERVQPYKDKAEEVNGLVQGLLHAERPFYGSIALASTLGEVSEQEVNIDAPGAAPEGEAAPQAEINEEHINKAKELTEACFAVSGKINEVLSGIKDKETADAAVPVLTALMEEMNAKAQAVAEFGESLTNQGEIAAISDTLRPLFDKEAATLKELDKLAEALAENDPPYFGSKGLAELLSDDGEDDEDDASEEQPTPDPAP